MSTSAVLTAPTTSLSGQPCFLQPPTSGYGQVFTTQNFQVPSVQQGFYSQNTTAYPNWNFHQQQSGNIIQQQLNQRQNASMLDTSSSSQVVDPTQYVYSNGEINWFAVNQNIPLQCYPNITKEILCSKNN